MILRTMLQTVLFILATLNTALGGITKYVNMLPISDQGIYIKFYCTVHVNPQNNFGKAITRVDDCVSFFVEVVDNFEVHNSEILL